MQNWIGGIDELVGYLNQGGHSAIVRAGLAHAQFETDHPFTDGNGRVGRALIHTVLTRRELTTEAVLPVSLVLSTLRSDYVDGLTSSTASPTMMSNTPAAGRSSTTACDC